MMITKRFRWISLGFVSMLLFHVGFASAAWAEISLSPFVDVMPVSHVDAMAEINATGHALKAADRQENIVVDRQSSSVASKHVQLLTALDGESVAA